MYNYDTDYHKQYYKENKEKIKEYNNEKYYEKIEYYLKKNNENYHKKRDEKLKILKEKRIHKRIEDKQLKIKKLYLTLQNLDKNMKGYISKCKYYNKKIIKNEKDLENLILTKLSFEIEKD
jgi:hypothetical protein